MFEISQNGPLIRGVIKEFIFSKIACDDGWWRQTDVERRPTAVRQRSAVVLQIVSGAPPKKHLIEAASFGRLDQMLRTTV